MSKARLFKSSFFIILLFSSCGEQSFLRNRDAEEAIRYVIEKQAEDWNRGSIEAYMEGYAKIDSVRFASGGKVSYGWQNMLDRYKKGYPTTEAMGKLFFSEIDIRILSNDAALVFGRWHLKELKDEPYGYFTLLFRKIDVGWRIVHDHTSSGK